MSTSSISRSLPRAVAVLLVVLASVFEIQTQASATARGHKCQVAFTEGVRQAVQCVDFNVFWNSSGDLAVQTLGASLCQATGGDPVRCAGIKQTVTIYATNTVPSNPDAHSTSTTQACGRRIASGAQCPASRQYGYSTGAYCHTNLTYVARIRTTFDMPSTGSPVTKVFEHRLPGSSICYAP